jgi:hypothetical protein
VAAAYQALLDNDADGFRQTVRTAGIRYDFSVSPLLAKPTAGAQTQTVQVFDPAGRKNLALGKPVTASSKIDVWTAPKAADGDLATYWEGGANQYPGTIAVDLAIPAQVSTVVLKLNPMKIWGKRTQKIEVKVSDNGSDYTTLVAAADYVFDPLTNGNVVAIPLSVKTRYIQLVYTANNAATNGQLAEFEVYGE